MSGYRDSNGNWIGGDGSVTSANGVQLGKLGEDVKIGGDGGYRSESGHLVVPKEDFPYGYDIKKHW